MDTGLKKKRSQVQEGVRKEVRGEVRGEVQEEARGGVQGEKSQFRRKRLQLDRKTLKTKMNTQSWKGTRSLRQRQAMATQQEAKVLNK